ncbi:unnamed protein product [Bursaphelenchus okinawaensis]|uniref:G_PROTEIN_RECEP_F1_2 domain-containing protein n=1 Tax=Bursaphelenchus okinawaensis TaxID=465554 RepID=A0A811LH61_9BILA|nr:unnamed protein product [Bursaphelenchus okinawaensis]CAG9123727.1 unnamed protein product [Bursaphelenchus okinawaensis]
MEVYLFEPDLYAEWYNCSQLSQEEWQQVGVKRPYLAMILGILGGAFSMFYMPFVFIMTKPRFFRMSCYKIMFCLGFIDALTIIISVGISGYFMFRGAVYCTMPNSMYLAGVAGVASWCGSCLLCAILALNRCLDLYSPHTHELLFDGNRTWFWIGLSILYMALVSWFESPIFYHSRYAAGFYDPFIGAPVEKRHKFVNYTHVINNVLVIVVMSVLYTVLCVYVLKRRTRLNRTKKNVGFDYDKTSFEIEE